MVRVASFALGLLTFAILTHWLVWRIRLPERQTRALLVWLLGLGPFCFLAGAYALTGPSFSPRSVTEILQVALFHVSMSLAYIVTYSALEEQSPTLALVRFIVDAGSAGRSRDELEEIINDDTMIRSRIAAAVRDDLTVERKGALELTDKGRRMARMFALYRRILGTPKGR